MDSQLNVLLVGDSIAKGVTYDGERSRHVLLPENVASLVSKGCSVCVENIAKFGSTIDRATRAFLGRITRADAPKPTHVAIEIGGNDCDYDWKAIARDPYGEHLPNTPPDEFAKKLEELISDVRENELDPVLLNLPPIDSKRYFDYFTGGDREMGESIMKFLGDVEHIYRWQKSYSDRIEAVGSELEVPVIDIRGAFMCQPDYRAFIAQDGLHPNEAGQQIMAQRVLDYINRPRPQDAAFIKRA